MKRNIIILTLVALFFTGCRKEADYMPYIGENGQLAYSTYTEQFDYLWRVLSTGYVFWDVDEHIAAILHPVAVKIARITLTTTIYKVYGILFSRIFQHITAGRTEINEGVVKIRFRSKFPLVFTSRTCIIVSTIVTTKDSNGTTLVVLHISRGFQHIWIGSLGYSLFMNLTAKIEIIRIVCNFIVISA